MARFDADAAYRFKRGPRGEILFFPRGSWGPGYIVPDEARAQFIAHRQDVLYRWAHLCTMLLVGLSPFGGLWKLVLFGAALAVTGKVVQWRLRPAMLGLPASDTRLHLREELAKAKTELLGEARGTSWWIRVALVVVFVALVVSVASR